MAASVKTNITEFVLIFESIKYKSLPSSVVPERNSVVIAVKLMGIESIAWLYIEGLEECCWASFCSSLSEPCC